MYDAGQGRRQTCARCPAHAKSAVLATGRQALYMVGPDIYKYDPQTGQYTVAIPSRNWKRPRYAPPDVLHAWPIQNANDELTVLYTTSKFRKNRRSSHGRPDIRILQCKPSLSPDRDAISATTEIYFTRTRSHPGPKRGPVVSWTKCDIKQACH